MLDKPPLPVPKGYFGALELSEDERTKIRDDVRAQLEITLADELAFVHLAKRQVDATKWRLVKRKRELRVFRRRAHAAVFTGDTAAPAEPSVLAVGRMEGAIEDLIFGAYSKSHDELKTTVSFTGAGATDCTVLGTLELATPEDPFHYLGLKWFYTQLPASLIIKPRDWCVAQATGIERDSHGAVFGYYLLQPVELRNCPPFDQRAVVRGRAVMSYIFREPVPGIVEVYSQGLFDPAGELLQRFSTMMTTEMLAGVLRLAHCAETKKLTLVALRKFYRRRAAPQGQPADDGAAKMCVRCRGSAGFFSSLKPCGVCGAVVCSQCRDKKPVFVGTSHSVCVVPCCRPCVTEAKSLAVRPGESSFSILGEQYLPQDEFSGLESFGSPDEQSTSAGARRRGPGCGDGQGKMAALSDDLSELDVDQYQFSDDEDSGISEGDLEKWQSWSGGSSSSSAPTSNSEDPSSMTFTSESRAASGLGEPSATDSSRGLPRTAPLLAKTSASVAAEAAAATVAAATATEAAVPAGAIAATSSLTPEQVAIYHKVLVLQSTADETYWAAQTSDECGPSVP